MSRRNWRIIAAAVGVALLALLTLQLYQFYQAAEQQHADYSYQPSSKPGFRIDAATKKPSGHYKPSCNNPNDREDADLCAQWASVDQVTESNRLASLSLRLTVLSFFSTVVATIFLIWTFWETRQTARRELRAYLFVDAVGISDGTYHPERDLKLLGKVGSAMIIKNSGSTPAHQVRHWSAIELAYFDKEAELRAPSSLEDLNFSTIPPGGPISADRICDRKPGAKMIAAIRAGRAAVFVFGAIEYRDVFDQLQRTNYRLYYCGIWPPPLNLNMRFSTTGNDAT